MKNDDISGTEMSKKTRSTSQPIEYPVYNFNNQINYNTYNKNNNQSDLDFKMLDKKIKYKQMLDKNKKKVDDDQFFDLLKKINVPNDSVLFKKIYKH